MDKIELANKIGNLRGRETQEAFGARFGVTRQTVMRWESGETTPPASALELMGIQIIYQVAPNAEEAKATA